MMRKLLNSYRVLRVRIAIWNTDQKLFHFKIAENMLLNIPIYLACFFSKKKKIGGNIISTIN